jgi:hypothetical protein
MEFNLNQLAELSIKQKKILYQLQDRANKWRKSTFTSSMLNWQDFSKKRAFENYTCIGIDEKGNKTISLVIIYFKIGDTIDESEFFTYKHTTNF